nr:metallophosphoesterase [candidate division Zixibacteria bacterium]
MRSYRTNFRSAGLLFLAIMIMGWFGPGVRADQSGSCPVRFAILGDRTGSHIEGIHEQVIAEVVRMRPDFVITVGDEVEGYVDDSARIIAEKEEYNTIISPLTMPFYHVPGNHDIWSDLSEKMYREIIGPPYYSFNRQGLHIVVLNYGLAEVNDSFPAEQLTWLENDLKANQQADYTLVFFHKPFWHEYTARGKAHPLHDLFVKYGVNAAFSGHYHEYFAANYDGVMYTNVGSSGADTDPDPTGLEYHFMWVTVDSTGIHPVPIKMGAVLPWDQVTVADRQIYNPLRTSGLEFKGQLPIGEDLKAIPSPVDIILKNSFSRFALDDTLRWETTDGWKITPEIMPVTAAAGIDGDFEFTAECTGPLFPLPGVAVNFNYAADKKVKVSKTLTVARQAECLPAGKKPKIDGDIKEKCWESPQTVLFNYDGSDMTLEPTKFFFAYDKDNLYVAAYCAESTPDSIRSLADKHDGPVYADDCVGYFLEPSFGSDSLFQIYFNSDGVVYDANYWIGEDGWLDGSREWNGQYEVKTNKGNGYWSIEARIPLKQFGLKMESGKKMRLNFRRKQQHLNAVADWQVPLEYEANTFGHLIMK